MGSGQVPDNMKTQQCRVRPLHQILTFIVFLYQDDLMKNLVVEKLPMLCQIAKLPNDTNCQMIKLPNDRYTVSEFCPFKNFSVNIFPSKFLFCQYFSPTLHSHHLSFSPLPEQSDMMKRGEKCRIIFADIQVGSSPHLIRLSVEHLPILDHT